MFQVPRRMLASRSVVLVLYLTDKANANSSYDLSCKSIMRAFACRESMLFVVLICLLRLLAKSSVVPTYIP
jgi:hypothetical protein